MAKGNSTSMSTLALIDNNAMLGKEPLMPKWLETSIEKKRSVIRLSMPMEDLVRKCLGRSSRVKKGKK